MALSSTGIDTIAIHSVLQSHL